MQTTLGLSMTSTSVGWILVDGKATDGTTLDHDAYAAQTGDSTSQLVAAARGAQSIAIAGGHHVGSIGVSWTDKLDVDQRVLLRALADLGFENVVPVPPARAAQAFAQLIGRRMGYQKTGVCVIEPAAVTAIVVDADDGAARTHTYTGDTGASLIRWLTKLFKRHDWQSEALYLVSPQTYRAAVKARLEAALPMRVFTSADAQLALAIGAALASSEDDIPRAPWLPPRTEALLTLVTCLIALIAAVALVPNHDSKPTDSLETLVPPTVVPAAAQQAPLPPDPVQQMSSPLNALP